MGNILTKSICPTYPLQNKNSDSDSDNDDTFDETVPIKPSEIMDRHSLNIKKRRITWFSRIFCF